jgi:Protein of unknown function (DUF3631)/Domain of unknown function (DUF3854)
MEPISPEPTYLRGVAHRYLTDRGIATGTIQAYGIQIETKPTSKSFLDRLGFDKLGEGSLAELANQIIWFPCLDSAGQVLSWIARPLPDIEEAKYLNPKGGAYPFIPRQTWQAAAKPHRPIIITEGPVKALALAQAGQLAIGVSGVWMATRKRADGNVELISALRQFEWSGRGVYLAFDADFRTNPTVRQALVRTFLSLYKQGAKARLLSWASNQGKGIDDYLCSKGESGSVGALSKLIEGACEIGKLIEPEDLTIIQNELAIANLSRAQLSQLSRILASPLKVKRSALEEDAAHEELETVGRAFTLTDPEPWPEPVEGIELIGETIEFLRRYVVMSEAEATAVALWISLTYLEQHVDTLPILAVTSPEKRCGKTTLLTIISKLARKALPAANVSSAALFRAIEKLKPTLLIDEGDTFLRDNEELRGIMNAGHTREFAFVLRTNPVTLEPERFFTWAPKAIACIGKLPETLSDRSVEIRLQRRTQKETAEKLRDADPETFTRLQRMAFRWSLDKGHEVKRARPAIPQILNDRASDNWYPLLAIAAVAGFDGVPNMAVRLSIELPDQESIKVLVLKALRDLFNETGDDFLPTDTIIGRLNQDKEAPWAGWENSMTPEKLAKTLKSYNVKSEQRQENGERHRGYLRKTLQAVFDRYLSPSSLLPQENAPQPVHLSADQVSETIGNAQVQGTQPEHAQVLNFNTSSADSLPEPIGKEMHKFQPKLQTVGMNGSVHSNGHDGDSDAETILSPENGYGTRPRLPKQGQG